MPINKQSININFAQGLDTKTDPKQVSVGKFLSLQNTVFSNGGLLKKRNGYGALTKLPNANSTYLTTFNGNLTALSSSILAYSASTSSWIQKGQIYPLNLNTTPLIRTNTSQTQVDMAIAPSGLACVVYTDSVPVSGTPTNFYKYAIIDSTSGQNIIAPVVIPIGSGAISRSPRVFLLGQYFIILFANVISGTTHLQYIAINTVNPSSVSANTDVASNISTNSGGNLDWDGVIVNNALYMAYYTTSGGTLIGTIYLNSSLQLSSVKTFSATQPTCLSMCADNTNPTVPIIYVTWYASPNIKILILDLFLNQVGTTYSNNVGSNINNITCVAQNASCSIFYEQPQGGSYDIIIPDDAIFSFPISQSGTIGSTYVSCAGIGIGSKAFILNGVFYYLAAYNSTYQPSYFLINASLSTSANPVVVAKLAYSNGGGYLTKGLPGVIVNGNTFQVPYLFKDLITSVSKATNVSSGTQVAGVYSQTGINFVTATLSSSNIDSTEIGHNLHFSGGFLWMYDGYLPVEHNFFLWPEYVETIPSAIAGGMSAQKYYYQAIYEWTDNQGNIHRSAPSIPVLSDSSGIGNTVSFTATFTSGTLVISVNNSAGLYVGMTITDVTTPASIQAGTTIQNIVGTSVTISLATTASGTNNVMSAVAAPISFTANLTKNNNQISVSSVSGLIVGQYLTDSTSAGNLQANTYITAINSPAKMVTLNLPATATVTGDTIITTSQGSTLVLFPSLRLTYKIASPVKIVVYRWSTAQQSYYQVTSITNPVLNNTTVDSLSFLDTSSDYQILGNSLIYTTGNVVEDVNAPAANIMTLWNDRLFLVDAEDQNLIWYSKQVIEATPVEMSDLLTIYVAPTIGASGSTGPITSLGAMDSNLIIFKRDAIYYITGTGPDNTGANNLFTDPIFITSVVGCINQQSIIFTPNGLMFQSDKGIWLLGRNLSTQYIGAEVEKFVLGQNVLSSVTVPGTNQVRFTMDSGITLVYDYYYGQWSTFVNIPSISSCIYNQLHTYLDSFGNVYQETPGSYLDGSNPVLVQFTTNWINLAGIQGYQRIYEFNLNGTYITPHVLSVGVAYDFEAISQVAQINPSNFTGLYGSDALYGQASPFGGNGSNENWRIHTQQQKCSAFQINIQEVFDSSYGTIVGAGLTLSGIDCVIGVKKSWKPYSAANTTS